MSNEPLTFDARPVVARKPHKCWACGIVIPVGLKYIAYSGKDNSGKFRTLHLCIECSFLLTQKTGANANSIRQGEFCERLLPNCLRKKRAEFRRDARAAVTAAGLLESSNPSMPKPCRQIVVKASEFNRRIFHLPESRYKVEQFGKSEQLIIRAGVDGESRTARIVGAWSTSGEAFGCKKRQVAVLVA